MKNFIYYCNWTFFVYLLAVLIEKKFGFGGIGTAFIGGLFAHKWFISEM